MKKKGSVTILSAPSGTGKSTICNILKQKIASLKFSVSHTSRQPREGEEDGVHYHFISKEEFESRIEDGEFLEWVELHGNYYGTSLAQINKSKNAGLNQILELDTQGVEMLKENGFDALYIFILPPSLKALERRLIKRGTESIDEIRRRIDVGKKEIMKYPLYEYVVTNVDANETADIIVNIMKSDEYKTKHFLKE